MQEKKSRKFISINFLQNLDRNFISINSIWSGEGGPLWPPYHESVCRCHEVRATKTKLPDLFPLDDCQVPGSWFWCLFFKKLKKFDVQNFLGALSIRRKSEKIEKKNFCLFFQAQSELHMFSAFIWGALHHKNTKFLKFLKLLNF